jgi:hypothetical protein
MGMMTRRISASGGVVQEETGIMHPIVASVELSFNDVLALSDSVLTILRVGTGSTKYGNVLLEYGQSLDGIWRTLVYTSTTIHKTSMHKGQTLWGLVKNLLS